MSYVRKKRVGGREYHQLVESHRVNGQPRQKVLVHLGRYATVEEALVGLPREIENARRYAELLRRPSLRQPWRGVSPSSLEHAESVERRADSLEARLRELRRLHGGGAA